VPDITMLRVNAALWCAVTAQGAHMKYRKTRWMIGIMASALAGCATAPSAVVPAGQDAYHVSVSGARYESQADTNLKALQVASEYCNQTAKYVMFRQSTETGQHAWWPKQEDLTFVCVDAKDPAFMRAAVLRVPPVIAQQ
jgi:hypothetical protein